MLPERGTIISSKAGRDSGKFMIVVGTENGNVLVADGKERPVERPKHKNLKHIQLTTTVVREEQMLTNRSIRHALSDFKADTVKERFECPKRI